MANKKAKPGKSKSGSKGPSGGGGGKRQAPQQQQVRAAPGTARAVLVQCWRWRRWRLTHHQMQQRRCVVNIGVGRAADERCDHHAPMPSPMQTKPYHTHTLHNPTPQKDDPLRDAQQPSPAELVADVRPYWETLPQERRAEALSLDAALLRDHARQLSEKACAQAGAGRPAVGVGGGGGGRKVVEGLPAASVWSKGEAAAA